MSPNRQNDAFHEEQPAERAWDPKQNEALAQLLAHLAEELASEYVRLMEAAAKEDPASSIDSSPCEE